jgi:hypothetical protein
MDDDQRHAVDETGEPNGGWGYHILSVTERIQRSNDGPLRLMQLIDAILHREGSNTPPPGQYFSSIVRMIEELETAGCLQRDQRGQWGLTDAGRRFLETGYRELPEQGG